MKLYASSLRLLLPALFIGATQFGASHAADVFTEKSVRDVVDAAEAAAKLHDPQKIATYMSDDIVIASTFPNPDGSKSVKEKHRQQYVLEEQESEKHAVDHVYASTAPTITIRGGQAIVRFVATEKATLDGKHMEATADQIETLELRDGQVLITRIETTATSLTLDGRRIF
ncbi:MAG: DUF4440 domain-containing protein [Dokdonella sp.]